MEFRPELLNQNSAKESIWEIKISIDSEKFIRKYLKMKKPHQGPFTNHDRNFCLFLDPPLCSHLLRLFNPPPQSSWLLNVRINIYEELLLINSVSTTCISCTLNSSSTMYIIYHIICVADVGTVVQNHACSVEYFFKEKIIKYAYVQASPNPLPLCVQTWFVNGPLGFYVIYNCTQFLTEIWPI